jgi:phytoene synthase
LTALLRFHVQVRAIATTVSDLSVAQAKLAWWGEQLDAMERGTVEHPTLRALAPFALASGLRAQALHGVIDSVQLDLQQNRWMDRPALLHYAKTGSGQTLRNSAVLLGLSGEVALALVEQLGVGLRLVSSIRHLGRDAAQGRIYLPLDALQRHGVTAAQLQQRRMEAGVATLLAEQSTLARQSIEQALAGLTPFARTQTAPLRALGAMALALLREIERADYAVLHQRISLTPLRKLWISRTCR